MVRLGHTRADAMQMTPRQLTVWLWVGQERHKSHLADTLALGALASQGDSKSIKEQLKKLEP
jgi:hypothetical protein